MSTTKNHLLLIYCCCHPYCQKPWNFWKIFLLCPFLSLSAPLLMIKLFHRIAWKKTRWLPCTLLLLWSLVQFSLGNYLLLYQDIPCHTCIHFFKYLYNYFNEKTILVLCIWNQTFQMKIVCLRTHPLGPKLWHMSNHLAIKRH